MTEENLNVENVEEVEQVDTQTETPQEEMYTKAQLEDIIAKRVQREKKATEKAVQEAEKLAKMNADEKEKYEREQLEKQLAEYKKKDQFYSLSKEAENMLRENDVQVDDSLLKVLVQDSAEDTQTVVNDFIASYTKAVSDGVKQTLAGTPARVNTGVNKGVTKDSIMAIRDTKKRIQAIQNNPQLFKQ